MADTIYDIFKFRLVTAQTDWDDNSTTVIRALLVGSTSTYIPAPTHNFVSDFTANGGVELATNNYSRQNISSRVVTRVDASNRSQLDAADTVFATLGPSSGGPNVKAVLLYHQLGGSDASPTDDPLICYLDSGGSKQVNGTNFTVVWPTSGILMIQ